MSSLTAADLLPTVKANRAVHASLVEPMVNVWFAPRNQIYLKTYSTVNVMFLSVLAPLDTCANELSPNIYGIFAGKYSNTEQCCRNSNEMSCGT